MVHTSFSFWLSLSDELTVKAATLTSKVRYCEGDMLFMLSHEDLVADKSCSQLDTESFYLHLTGCSWI